MLPGSSRACEFKKGVVPKLLVTFIKRRLFLRILISGNQAFLTWGSMKPQKIQMVVGIDPEKIITE